MTAGSAGDRARAAWRRGGAAHAQRREPLQRPSIEALHAALDQVDAVDGPAALVTTGAGKFFSNGLDLDWYGRMRAKPRASSTRSHRLLGRVLGFGAAHRRRGQRPRLRRRRHARRGPRLRRHAGGPRLLVPPRGRPRPAAHRPCSPWSRPSRPARRCTTRAVRSSLHGPEALAAGIVDEPRPRPTCSTGPWPGPSSTGKNREVIAQHKRLSYGAALECAACSDGAQARGSTNSSSWMRSGSRKINTAPNCSCRNA